MRREAALGEIGGKQRLTNFAARSFESLYSDCAKRNTAVFVVCEMALIMLRTIHEGKRGEGAVYARERIARDSTARKRSARRRIARERTIVTDVRGVCPSVSQSVCLFVCLCICLSRGSTRLDFVGVI